MGIHGHDDTFIINDIAFTVPPTQITVEKDAVNHNWQTLRTRDSQTVKSGKGVVSIRFTAVFVGVHAINTQLRPLIAQLNLTPICFAENQYIRDTLDIDGNASTALILKSLALTVQPELKDTVVAHFDFAWFNYKPYVPELRFKRDVLDNTPEVHPSDSIAWKKFYQAEMGVGGSPRYAKIPNVMDGALTFLWNELFLERQNLNGPAENIRRTEIVYETSNARENGLRLFTADRRLSCDVNSGLIVTGLTILFENIVAALPVIGHQYMTYQHIGSIDPRVIVQISAMGDAPKDQVTEMWTMLQEDALKFRHVPQEFLSTTIQNELVNLAGLKKFIPESCTTETIPGQPGTYSINLRLKAVEYEKIKERLQAEYVTQDAVREAIFKVLNGTLRPKEGLLFQSWETKISNRPDHAALQSISKKYAELVSNAIKFAYISITSGAVVGPAVTSVGRAQRGISTAAAASTVLPLPVAALLGVKTTDPLKGEELIAAGQNPLARMARKNLDLLEKDTTELFRLVKQSVLDQLESASRNQIRQGGKSYLETLKALPVPENDTRTLAAFLDNLGRGAIALADNIVLDGTIDLPEFRAAKELSLKFGSFRGSSAYPDFPALAAVASQEGIDPLQLDPAFYFYSPAIDGLTNLIDPGMMQAAESAAKTLYTEQESTGSNFGDFINSIGRFMEDNYVNRFEPNTPARKSLDQAKNRIQAIFPEKRAKRHKSKIMPETAADLDFTNATANGRSLSSFKQSTENALNVLPSSDTETFVQSKESLTHNVNVERVFSKDTANYSLPEIRSMGLFMRPVTGITTSPYGPRDVKSNPEASKYHKGIDLRAASGTPVLASANGRVMRVGLQDPKNDKVGWGRFVHIKHKNGYSTIYAHLRETTVKNRQAVRAGDVIGYSGGDANDPGSGNSKSAHLHFEIWDERNKKLDPEKVLAGSNYSRDTSSGEGSQFGTSLLARSVESLQDSLLNGQGPSMARAYPTFKLYFMEEDHEDRIFGFDDFFSYHAVKSIRVVRSRKVPADLCVIELTNVSGILSNRKFANDYNNKGEPTGSKPRDEQGKILEEKRRNVLGTNTAKENPIASLMLQQGTRICLRLGYSNDPEKLDDVFVGQISEVEFNNTDDLVTIVCQSYATELVQMVKGLDKPDTKSGWFLGTNRAATARLLSDLLQEPEVLHFGRWIRSRSLGTTAGIFSTDKGSNTNLDILSSRYAWRPRPQDDNIFAPTVSGPAFKDYFNVQALSNNQQEEVSSANYMLDSIGVPPSFQFSFLTYNITKSTIWDIFKEMELRHPGCIASPVPYRDARQGPRMTMFFGFPNQLYFARDPNPEEQRRNSFITNTLKRNIDKLTPELDRMHDLYGTAENTSGERLKRGISAFLEQQVGLQIAGSPTLTATTFGGNTAVGLGLLGHGLYKQATVERSIKREQLDAFDKHVRKQLALKDKSIRPFRSYHIITSNNHIIQNNICASALDVFNSVAIEATSEGWLKKALVKGTGLVAGTAPSAALGFALSSLGGDYFNSTEVFRLKADAGIPDEEVREAFLQYPNCVGQMMSEAYALGALKNLLRDIYKGEIVMIGNPSIKPYDICYVFDEYTDMVGPVEVEQVVHYFSQETGFVTEVTPDICVNINEWTTLGTMDGVGLVAESLIASVFGRPLTKIGELDDARFKGEAVSKLRSGALTVAGITLPVLALPGGPAIAGAAAAGVAPTAVTAAALGLTGAFIMSKLVHWSKFRHPIALSPLLYKGKPLMAGMGNKVVNANWWTDLTKWFKDGVDGVGLYFGDIGDRLVLAGSTGNLSNMGITRTEF